MIVVLKVTKGCNLRCHYCYMPLQSDAPIMSQDVVNAVIEKIGGKYKFVNYSWHGGEPLLAGISFYQKALQAQKAFYQDKPELGYRNSLQTNGTLITEEWFKFFQENSMGIGFSYDGPGEANRLRCDLSGNPVSPKILDMFAVLKSHYNYSPGLICVLSKANVDHGAEIYHHFKKLGVQSFSLLPYLGQRQELRVSSDEYFAFHQGLFDLWINDATPFSRITPFTEILSSFLQKDKHICSWDGRCFHDLVTINPDGKVFACSAFHDPVHCLGNILTDSLQEIFDSANYHAAIASQKSVLTECESCEIFDTCKGGCREAAYYTYGKMDAKDPFCEGRKALVNHILTRFHDSVKQSAYCQSENK